MSSQTKTVHTSEKIRWDCVDAAAQLKTRLIEDVSSVLSMGQSECSIEMEVLLEAVCDIFTVSSLNPLDHHSTVLGVLFFESEKSSPCFVAASTFDKRALRRGCVWTGNDMVWTIGEPPGIWRVYDEDSNAVVFSGPDERPCYRDPISHLAKKRPWISDCLEGNRWSRPYLDAVTGEYIESYVVPLESPRDGSVLGIIMAGSFTVQKETSPLKEIAEQPTWNNFQPNASSADQGGQGVDIDPLLFFQVIKPPRRQRFHAAPNQSSSQLPTSLITATTTTTRDQINDAEKQVSKVLSSQIESSYASTLAARSAGLLSRARKERERLQTIRALINEDNSSPAHHGQSRILKSIKNQNSLGKKSPTSNEQGEEDSFAESNQPWIGEIVPLEGPPAPTVRRSQNLSTPISISKRNNQQQGEESSLWEATFALDQCRPFEDPEFGSTLEELDLVTPERGLAEEVWKGPTFSMIKHQESETPKEAFAQHITPSSLNTIDMVDRAYSDELSVTLDDDADYFSFGGDELTVEQSDSDNDSDSQDYRQ